MSDEPEGEGDGFRVELSRADGWAFDAGFDQAGVPDCRLDEPAPMGDQTGPNASRALAAAVGNCLSASLLFCLRKFGREPEGMHTVVDGRMTRNERGRLRIGDLTVTVHLTGVDVEDTKVRRCRELFEDFCPVTASVSEAIPVEVTVTSAGP